MRLFWDERRGVEDLSLHDIGANR